ncbi:MAG: polysaccharide deacetylase family protein [Solirubrobacteraceae bacterium]|jgi:peptidoglycan/xylan/chitin deacetylase (PgdA/CDA1 family)
MKNTLRYRARAAAAVWSAAIGAAVLAAPAQAAAPPQSVQSAHDRPQITLQSPTMGVYAWGQVIDARYSCVDGGSTITQCSGTVANGSPIDTSEGMHTFTVTATNALGGQSSMSVMYISMGWMGSCANGYVALSFDDGPDSLTKSYVSALVAQGARATFFDIGDNIETYPSDVALEADWGMAIGDHTMTHPDLTTLSMSAASAELAGQMALVKQDSGTGYVETLARPPYGASDAGVFNLEESLGLTETRWSIDTNDWQLPSVQAIVTAATSDMQNGSIILEHDGYPNTLAAINPILDYMRAHSLCPGAMVPSWTPLAASNNPWGSPNYVAVVPWTTIDATHQ